MRRWKNGNLKKGIKRYWNVMHKIGTRLPKAPITEPASQVGVYQHIIYMRHCFRKKSVIKILSFSVLANIMKTSLDEKYFHTFSSRNQNLSIHL